MFDINYAIAFYENYKIIFYLIIFIAVILEWPITVLSLAIFAPKLGIWFPTIFLFAFLWDFLWDSLHFFVWRFVKWIALKNKNFSKAENLFKKIENYSFFDKLIVIKYTPPITSIWLLYMWFTKIWVKEFLLKNWVLCLTSAIILSSIWIFIGEKFADNKNILIYLFIAIWAILITVYFLSKLIIKIVNKKNNNYDT